MRGKISDPYLNLYNLNQLGLSYYANYIHNQALECFQEITDSAGKYEGTDFQRLLGASYVNTSLIYREKGNFEKANSLVETALPIFLSIDKKAANSLGTLGINYMLLGDFELAIKYLQDSNLLSKEMVTQSKVYTERLGIHTTMLGEVKLLQGKFTEAFTIASEGLQYSEKVQHRTGRISALLVIANSQLALGKTDSARQSFANALQLDASKYRPACSLGLGIVELLSKNIDIANEYLCQTVETSGELLSRAEDLFEQHFNLALALLALKQGAEAIEAYRQALTITCARGVLIKELLYLGILERTLPDYSTILEIRKLIYDAQPDLIKLKSNPIID